MKRHCLIKILSLLIPGVLLSCTRTYESEWEEVVIGINVLDAGGTKAVGVVDGGPQENRINDVQVILFDAGGAADGYAALGQQGTVRVRTHTGEHEVWAFSNFPSVAGIADKGALEALLVRLEDVSFGNMPLYGMKEVKITRGFEGTVPLDHFLSRVTVSKITNLMENDILQAEEFRVLDIYLTNVPATVNVGKTAVASTWYNKMGLRNEMDTFLHDAVPEGSQVIPLGSSYNVRHSLYSLPNIREEDDRGDAWSPRRTRLIVKAMVGSEVNYYPITLPVMQSNRSYNVSELVITRLGVLREETDLPFLAITFNMHVDDMVPVEDGLGFLQDDGIIVFTHFTLESLLKVYGELFVDTDMGNLTSFVNFLLENYSESDGGTLALDSSDESLISFMHFLLEEFVKKYGSLSMDGDLYDTMLFYHFVLDEFIREQADIYGQYESVSGVINFFHFVLEAYVGQNRSLFCVTDAGSSSPVSFSSFSLEPFTGRTGDVTVDSEYLYDIDICGADDMPSSLSYTYLAGDAESKSFSVRSRKSGDGGITWIPTPWKAQWWDDSDGDGVQDDDEWFDVDPSDYPVWLKGISPVSVRPSSAGYEGEGYSVTMTGQTVQSHEDRLRTAWVDEIAAARQNVGNAYDKARVNLHMWNHLTHSNGSGVSTANSYIVQGPGDYIFPMVYGNGVDEEFQGLNPNVEAYDPPGAYGDYLDCFHNHTRNSFDYSGIVTSDRIKDAWISRHGTSTSLGVTTDYYGHHCTEVGVLWQDFKNGEDVITDVGYLETATYADNKADRYITFSVGDNISPGNALIYVKDTKLDVIAWTWHIWITDQTLEPVTMSNSSSDSFTLQPVNLGWVDDSEGLYYPPRTGVIRFVCTERESVVSPTLTLDQSDYEAESTSGWAPYFQWGRKDPIREGATLVNDEAHHIYYSIQNPDKFLSAFDTVQSHYDWTDNDYLNLWRSKYYYVALVHPLDPMKNTAVEKSVYDPCPRGYKVPAGNTWTGLDLSGDEVSGKGRYFPTTSGRVFFPAMGYINGTGAVTGKGTSGLYWLDVPAGTSNRLSYCLSYSSGIINVPGSSDRAYGLQVRCEREDANTSM